MSAPELLYNKLIGYVITDSHVHTGFKAMIDALLKLTLPYVRVKKLPDQILRKMTSYTTHLGQAHPLDPEGLAIVDNTYRTEIQHMADITTFAQTALASNHANKYFYFNELLINSNLHIQPKPQPRYNKTAFAYINGNFQKSRKLIKQDPTMRDMLNSHKNGPLEQIVFPGPLGPSVIQRETIDQLLKTLKEAHVEQRPALDPADFDVSIRGDYSFLLAGETSNSKNFYNTLRQTLGDKLFVSNTPTISDVQKLTATTATAYFRNVLKTNYLYTKDWLVISDPAVPTGGIIVHVPSFDHTFTNGEYSLSIDDVDVKEWNSHTLTDSGSMLLVLPHMLHTQMLGLENVYPLTQKFYRFASLTYHDIYIRSDSSLYRRGKIVECRNTGTKRLNLGTTAMPVTVSTFNEMLEIVDPSGNTHLL